MAVFGQPKAYNKWFGNQLVIPEAQRNPLVNVGNTGPVYPGFGHSAQLAPPPPPVPGAVQSDRQRQYQEQQQGGDNGPDFSAGPSEGTGSAPDWLGTVGKYAASGLLGGIPGLVTQGAKDIYGNLTSDNDPVAAATAANRGPQQMTGVGGAAIPGAPGSMDTGAFPDAAARAAYGEAIAAGLSSDEAQTAGWNAHDFGAPTYAGPELDVEDYNKQFSNNRHGAAASGHGSHAGAGTGPQNPHGIAVEAMGQAANNGVGYSGTAADVEAYNNSMAEQGIEGYSMSEGAAGEGDPGTVICTALHAQGFLPDEVFLADAAYGRTLDPAVLDGYRKWATPIAKLMERNRTFAAIMAPITVPWAQHMYGNKNWLGALYLKVGVPICRWLGK